MSATQQSLEERVRRMDPVSAEPEQQGELDALMQVLGRYARRQRRRDCKLVGPDGETMVLPEAVFHVLARVVDVLAHGDAVSVVPVGKQLTTQQAANLLNVSRQYLVRLLEHGKLPHSKVGKHRRIRVDDVLAFKRQRDDTRKKALDQLSEMTEEFSGYRELE